MGQMPENFLNFHLEEGSKKESGAKGGAEAERK